MEESKQHQETDFLSEKKAGFRFRIYRKIFLLIFAAAVLVQGVLLADNYAGRYYDTLKNSFKVLLPLQEELSESALKDLAAQLRRQEGIAAVEEFSSRDALGMVRRQNPQLADTLLLLGTHKMPAYLEVRLSDSALANITTFTESLAVQYPQVQVRFNQEHARLTANTSMFRNVFTLLQAVALFALLLFMFLVEASPVRAGNAWAGVCSGLLAGVGACALMALLLYPTGLLPDIWRTLVSYKQQVVVLVFSGLLGWTFSKWQRF